MHVDKNIFTFFMHKNMILIKFYIDDDKPENCMFTRFIGSNLCDGRESSWNTL